MKLSKQCQKIYNILQDGEFHCPSEWGYADGHCKRITDLNLALKENGQEIRSEPCNCGIHTSRILKRRLAAIHETDHHDTDFMKDFRAEFMKPKEKLTGQLTLI